MVQLRVPRRRMWRSAVSRTERIIGIALLVLVVGIGVAVGVKGRYYDPNLFALDDALLGEAPTPFARVLPVAWEAAEWKSGQTIDRYGPNNLYEKINGRADQYLSYAVQGLEFQSFSYPDGRFIDVYLYDMGTPLNAFGIFSAERTPGAAPVELGQEGYNAGGTIFFHQGQFYAQVIPSEGDADSVRAALELAGVIGASMPQAAGAAEAVDPTAKLPPEGLDAESVQYVREDALGLDFLRNAVTATYDAEGEFVTLFLIQESSPSAAAAVADQYVAYLVKYGTIVDDQSSPAGRRVVGDVGGFHDVVFIEGSWVGGVSGALNRAAAEALVQRAIDGLTNEGTKA